MSATEESIRLESIAIVAKFPVYFESIQKRFQESAVQVISFQTFSELNNWIGLNKKPNLVFFPHISEVIPENFLNNFICIGFHTGDLPNDRGGSPIQYKILAKEYVTKVSAFKMTKEIDAGDVYSSREIDLSLGNIKDLIDGIAEKVSEMVYEIVTLMPIPFRQTKTTASRKRLNANDGILDFENLTKLDIYDRIRMLDGYDYPRAYALLGPYRLEFSEARFEDDELSFLCRIKGDD
jgi:methionyl-tRNA formyltransferase